MHAQVLNVRSLPIHERMNSTTHWRQVVHENGKIYQRVLPSFLNLLVRLKRQGRSYCLVLHSPQRRKLKLLASAFDAFALGQHFLFTEAYKYINLSDLRCQGKRTTRHLDAGWVGV